MSNLLIVIVIYNKKIINLPILSSNKKAAFLELFVYDNSELAQEVPKIENVNIYYEHDENNSGVSRAYNQAYKKAKELDKKLLLILDQDTAFEPNFIDKYMDMYLKYKNDFLYAPIVTNFDKTKIYSPSFMSNFVGKAQDANDFVYKEKYSLAGKSVINSGLMIPLELFEKIGGYNEKLKLDFSDVYFIEKYKKLNTKIILVNVYLKHSISGDDGVNFAKEYNRFKYYCSAAREISNALNTNVFWPPLRRLIRLILKYKNLKFIRIFYDYYLRGKEI